MPITRPSVFTGKNATYDDKFEDVMTYANAKLSQLGTIKTIRSEKDLRSVLQELNNLEARKSKSPRMSEEFVEKIINTTSASKSKGLRLGAVKPGLFRSAFHGFLKGRRPALATSRDDAPRQETIGAGGLSAEELKQYRAQGRELYTYDGGVAVKEVRRGSIWFRDARTGRYLSRSVQYDDL